jgi:hypothetical protein
MSDGNGSGRIITPGFQPPRRVADLNSQQRSQLMDETLMAVHELMLTVATLARLVSELQQQRAESMLETAAMQARLDAHAGVVLRPTLWGRLRWMVSGL